LNRFLSAALLYRTDFLVFHPAYPKRVSRLFWVGPVILKVGPLITVCRYLPSHFFFLIFSGCGWPPDLATFCSSHPPDSLTESFPFYALNRGIAIISSSAAYVRSYKRSFASHPFFCQSFRLCPFPDRDSGKCSGSTLGFHFLSRLFLAPYPYTFHCTKDSIVSFVNG